MSVYTSTVKQDVIDAADAFFEEMKAVHIANGGVVTNGVIIHVEGKQGTERWDVVESSHDDTVHWIKEPPSSVIPTDRKDAALVGKNLTKKVAPDDAWKKFSLDGGHWTLALNTSINGTTGANQWTDVSGKNNHATEASNPPLLGVNTLNGHPVYNFDGSKKMTTPNAIATAETPLEDETLFIVCRGQFDGYQYSYNPALGVSGKSYLVGSSEGGRDLSWLVNGQGIGTSALRATGKLLDNNRWTTITCRRSVSLNIIEWFENGKLLSKQTHNNGSLDSGSYLIGTDQWNHKFIGDIAAIYTSPTYMPEHTRKGVEAELVRTFQHYTHADEITNMHIGVQRYFHRNGYTSLAQLPAEETLSVVAGQSNAVGWTSSPITGLPAALQLEQTDIKIWDGTTFSNLHAGVNNQGASNLYHGAEMTLMRTLVDARGGTGYLVKYAVGGTNLHTDWNVPDGYRYGKLIETVEGAIYDMGDTNGIRMNLSELLWYQGENDSVTLEAGQAYLQNEIDLFNAIRNEFGAGISFLNIQIVWNSSNAGYDAVRQAKANHAALDANVHLVTEWTEKTTGDHISSQESQDVGYWAAQKALGV